MEKPTGEKLPAPQLTISGRARLRWPAFTKERRLPNRRTDLEIAVPWQRQAGALALQSMHVSRLCRASPYQTWRDYFSAKSL